jgi:hypothetical protein
MMVCSNETLPYQVAIVAFWPKLPEHIKATVIALVKAGKVE